VPFELRQIGRPTAHRLTIHSSRSRMEGATVRLLSHGDHHHDHLRTTACLVGIGFFCWLLFTLAVFALPFFVGLTIGTWTFHTGAGVLGGAVARLTAGGATICIGQLALAFLPWSGLES